MKLWQKIAGTLTVVGVAASPAALDKLDKYEDPPAPTVFETLLEKSSNKGLAKADKLARVKIKHLFKEAGEFSLRGIDVRVIALNRIGERLKVDLTAERDGVPLVLDTPYWFVNPPVKVPNGKYHKELDEDGVERDVANFKFDPAATLEEIIVQTIESQLK